ncbi:MAG: hypothetical protein ACJ76D_01490 [Solirubrobacterales bacterium]
MSDFETARSQLLAARAAQAEARLAHTQARETQRALAQEGESGRVAQKAASEVAAARASALEAGKAAAAALEGFSVFSDPRRMVGQLPDRSPLALLPVRIETRFATVGEGGESRRQLWVRIYPDDCSIDTFEPTLSSTEIENAKRYWMRIWRSGGVEDDERAAWRDLVAAHGSGRAGFVVDEYEPANLGARPAKAQPRDQILVIPTQAPLGAAEAGAVAAYWEAVWLAADEAALQAAGAALIAAVGGARADELRAGYVPFNLADVPPRPARKHDVALSTAFVAFGPDPPPKQSSWSQAPQIKQFPERFVVIGYRDGKQVLEAISEHPVATPLYVGPDPAAEPKDSIHPDGEKLVTPEELRWLVDFERAVEAGVGLAIDLDSGSAGAGFDRLLVLGVQLGLDDEEGKAALEELLHNHRVGRSGLSLVPQGTPTHNTTGAKSGYTRLDDADQSFDDRRKAPLFTPSDDPGEKRDGQWLAEALGIDPTQLQGVHGAGGVDQQRARAMQRALWPATLGYWMDKMLTPVFGDETVAQARAFFGGWVSGRGSVPAVRIGTQAYGVLPTTAFSRIGWLDEQPRGGGRMIAAGRGEAAPTRAFLARVLALLRAVDADWTAISAGAAHVGRDGDPHQTLLDVVGLHPDSAEFHWRYSESLKELYNVVNLWGFGPKFWNAWQQAGLQAGAAALLGRLGYEGPRPDILEHVFMRDSGLIDVVVDDRPSSETEPVREYTDDHRNYIRWLIDAAGASLDAVTAEEGFTDGASPRALLYLYLRHALLLGYYDTSYELHKSADFLAAEELLAMKPEPTFIHVDPEAEESESRYAALYKVEPRITQSQDLLVSDYISANLERLGEAAGLSDQIEALRVLEQAPTAELERLFAEHVDVLSYRFDAWLLALVSHRLQNLRAASPIATAKDAVGSGGGQGTGGGIYLGAYAWVEDLRPAGAQLEPVELPTDLEGTFTEQQPLRHDPANGGYIHAPSLTHARTAAVLRSGYLANASPQAPDALAVNLSSDRVRLALSLLEGIRNGQSLGALLGYRFERGLHDAHGLAEVDKFIYPLRRAFPLVADSLAPTQTQPDVSIEAIEARNVLDGRKLLARVRSTGKGSYPFGLSDEQLPEATVAEAEAVNAQVEAMRDIDDAVADVALAEGVHQAVQGNFDRAAATLDAYGSATFPPDPEVVQTPAPGIGLTHRVALHLRPGLVAPPNATPRATAEPAIDKWLEGMLPPLGKVGCTVSWADPVTGSPDSAGVTLADLHLHPLDVLELVRPDDVQAMSELDDRIIRCVRGGGNPPRADAELFIEYRAAPAGKPFSVFELSAPARNLRKLVGESRALRATDSYLGNDARPAHDEAVFVEAARITGPKEALDTLFGAVETYLAALQPLVADPVANRGAILGGVDAFLDEGVALLERAARFGIPQSGWGFAYDWRRQAMHDLLSLVETRGKAWDKRLEEFDQKIADYDALPSATPDFERFELLQVAEVLVAAILEPPPSSPAALRAGLDAQRTALQAKRDEFHAVSVADHASFAAALNAVRSLLPIDALDLEPFDPEPAADGAVIFAEDLAGTVGSLREELAARRKDVETQLQAHAAATTAPAQVEALQAAARALFGESFALLPEFGYSPGQGGELAAAVAAGESGALLSHLTTNVGVERPVEEWLLGAARVRPALGAWQTCSILAGTFERSEPVLTPAQLPFNATASWLALEFPPSPEIDGDRLLYTAHHATPFEPAARQCGLLLDEWTEVIPGTDRDTGISFNFDRPDNEAPQSILLVTPATADGAWHWDDVVGAVNETLDLAKKRAIEPAMVDPTMYSRFLPATIMAVTLRGISIATILAVSSDVMKKVEVKDDA